MNHQVIVVGSANLDQIVRVSTPPAVGQTVLAKSLVTQPGGKGANQAVAAARLGAKVSFIAALGQDGNGALLIDRLRAEGVDLARIVRLPEEPTGLALVSVYDDGDNSIVVVPGANHGLSPHHVRTELCAALAQQPGVVVIQGEVPGPTIEQAVNSAAEGEARVVLNLAPFVSLPPACLAVADPLVVNESEAAQLTGQRIHTVAQAVDLARTLAETVTSVVVTLGAHGAVWAAPESSGHSPAPAVAAVVDTTGAGDAFVGALAARLAAGFGLADAVEVAVAAGSFAVGALGAQASYPGPADLGLS